MYYINCFQIKIYYKQYDDFISWLTNKETNTSNYIFTNGILININNHMYILTTANVLKNYDKILLLYKNKEYNITLNFILHEFNLALFDCNNIINNLYNNIKWWEDIKLYECNKIIHRNTKLIHYKTIDSNIIIEKKYNIHFPDILIISTKINTKNIINNGIMLCDKKIIGIISENNNNTIYGIPNYIINKFITLFSTNRYINLPNLYFDLNHNTITNLPKLNEYSNFKINDTIVKINDIIVSNGYIFDNNINLNIPLKMYIMMYFNINDTIKFVLKRNDKIITIDYKLEYYNNKLYIPYTNTDSKIFLRVNNDIYIKLYENVLEQLLLYNYDVNKLLNMFVFNNLNNKNKCMIKINKYNQIIIPKKQLCF